MAYQSLQHRWKRVRAGLTLPPVTLYGLRHAHAWLLLLQQQSVHSVAQALGHTSVALVQSTYGGVFRKAAKERAAAMDAALAEPLENPRSAGLQLVRSA
jgi:integrase